MTSPVNGVSWDVLDRVDNDSSLRMVLCMKFQTHSVPTSSC